MEVEEDEEEDKKTTEKPNNYMRKFEQMELADTETVQRSDETIMGTNENLCPKEVMADSSRVDLVMEYRTETTSEEMKEWLQLCSSVHELSENLTEQLRLILEPTKATKFKGDFKSGKKLNMRKIIPFIASNYRYFPIL
jgi:midasin (ATPase involved in ribosome maturation)